MDFPEGTVTVLRAVDAGGARFLARVNDTDGIVSAGIIGDFALRVGRVLSAEEAGRLTDAAHQLQVFDTAVALLSVKARSARDLRVALRRRGATDEEAAITIARLEELQVIDDAAYARAFARSRAVTARISRRRLQQELARRGVGPEVARAAVGEVLDEVGLDEHGAALAAARKRLRSLVALPGATARQRLYGYLARRGYDAAVVSRVIREVLGADDADDLEVAADS